MHVYFMQVYSTHVQKDGTERLRLIKRKLQHELQLQKLKRHQTTKHVMADMKVMKFIALLIPSMLILQLPPELQGESLPAAAACQQAVMEAESVSHCAHTSK